MPVIVPQDIREVLQYLVNAEVREQAGVLQKNNYLFPNRSKMYCQPKQLNDKLNIQKVGYYNKYGHCMTTMSTNTSCTFALHS